MTTYLSKLSHHISELVGNLRRLYKKEHELSGQVTRYFPEMTDVEAESLLRFVSREPHIRKL